MKTNPSPERRGQILPGAIAMLLILAVMVPAIVYWVQREGVYASKQSHNTTAFHLAEAGAEKAYLYISLSTITWNSIQAGEVQDDYNFDKTFEDIPGGTYTISITSGPGVQQATIISVGRDRFRKETRALRVVYSNSILGDTAIYSGRGVQIGNNVTVEWGGVMSPYTIMANNANHPQFWSASQITTKDTNPDPPNCDGDTPADGTICCQWHSYEKSLPSTPSIDLDFYRASAAATTGCPSHAGAAGALLDGTPSPGRCYYPGAVTNWDDTTNGKTIFMENDLTVKSNGMFHTGTMIVMGNVNLPNGQWGDGNVTMSVPSSAWKQYCNDWDHYHDTFDSAGPAVFPGLNSDYAPTGLTHSSSKVAVNGFLYVGGNFNNGGGGGGNSDVYGVLYAVGTTTMTPTSNDVTFFYNGQATANLVTTDVSLTRVSWKDELRGWPSGL
ncbi:MAG: hypothetical protein HY403_05090 [Elusimicrobia bacterium]|nr:hypothetical protein [Elusimicrobiota bacterium]